MVLDIVSSWNGFMRPASQNLDYHESFKIMGYHKSKIEKGTLGEVSKIKEEYSEFLDAIENSNHVMALIELSDLLGAIESYTTQKYNIDLKTLLIMTEATKSAFTDGTRTCINK